MNEELRKLKDKKFAINYIKYDAKSDTMHEFYRKLRFYKNIAREHADIVELVFSSIRYSLMVEMLQTEAKIKEMEEEK